MEKILTTKVPSSKGKYSSKYRGIKMENSAIKIV